MSCILITVFMLYHSVKNAFTEMHEKFITIATFYLFPHVL